MANIRIIAVPPGEAPEEVRQAWVGLSLPLAQGKGAQPRSFRVGGVLSGFRGFFASLLAVLLEQGEVWEGYAVETTLALQILSRTDPEAANWWYREAPHLNRPGAKLIFPARVCLLEA